MNRKTYTITSSVQSLTLSPDETLCVWLTKQAKNHRLEWLLAHVDDKVIWGELRNDSLYLSCDGEDKTIAQGYRSLDWTTLQQCRLFGINGELLIWQGPQSWQAHLRLDTSGRSVTCLDECYLLWGNKSGAAINGFKQYNEGSRGIKHSPPLDHTPTNTNRAMLQVRHYLTEDTAGIVRIAYSRLVTLLPQKKGKSNE